MKKRMACVIIVATVVLLGTCFEFGNPFPQPTRALSQGDGDVDAADFLAWQRNIGIIPTQMLRITVANRSTGRNVQPLSFQVAIFDQNGVRVFQTDRREVPPQGFRYEDILFGDLGAIEPEPMTRRLQGALDILITVPDRKYDVGLSLEVVDIETGKTTVYDQSILSKR